MIYTDYYKFPLKLDDCNKVWTVENKMAFDFPVRGLDSKNDCHFISEDSHQKVVNILNGGDQKINVDLKLSYNESIIFAEIDGSKKQFISIRGWGALTGTGGLHLDGDIAAKMQDEFAEFIIEKINERII